MIKATETQKPDKKWFDLLNTTVGVVLGFLTRQCVLVRNLVQQSLQQEMDDGSTNASDRAKSDQILKDYALTLSLLELPGTNLLQEIKIKYPNAIKP